MKARYFKYILKFKNPGGTSRGVLESKETWILLISEGSKTGIGECGMFRGLSFDDRPNFENKLQWVCDNISLGLDVLYNKLKAYPSIQFGLEVAFLSLKSINKFILFPSDFTLGKANIPINGLIWMGSIDFIKRQISDKIKTGYNCIKLKIGAINFQTEIEIIKSIRASFSSRDIEVRVDANGAFSSQNVLKKLDRLARLNVHSIEQPIEPGHIEDMARLCKITPLPIALDEELIGLTKATDKQALLRDIKPQYIILKPTLIGGFKGSLKWIELAENENVGWWITSALESNIGLNAIAQWAFNLNNSLPQGLGTGRLFANNFISPLEVAYGKLYYNIAKDWNINF